LLSLVLQQQHQGQGRSKVQACGCHRLLLPCQVLLLGQPYQHLVLRQHLTPHTLLLQPWQLLLLVHPLSTRAGTHPTTACGKQLQLRCQVTPLVLLFQVLLLLWVLLRGQPCWLHVLLQHLTPHKLLLRPLPLLLLMRPLSTRGGTHLTTVCGKQLQRICLVTPLAPLSQVL
jgi:hypothetical protein